MALNKGYAFQVNFSLFWHWPNLWKLIFEFSFCKDLSECENYFLINKLPENIKDSKTGKVKISIAIKFALE